MSEHGSLTEILVGKIIKDGTTPILIKGRLFSFIDYFVNGKSAEEASKEFKLDVEYVRQLYLFLEGIKSRDYPNA